LPVARTRRRVGLIGDYGVRSRLSYGVDFDKDDKLTGATRTFRRPHLNIPHRRYPRTVPRIPLGARRSLERVDPVCYVRRDQDETGCDQAPGDRAGREGLGEGG
jgi:hypothetical protein